MTYRAIYTYAWDLAEHGVARAVEQFLALGLDTVTIAGSYHAGKFLRPHGKRERYIFPKTARSISRPTPSAMARSSRSPIRCSQERDVLRELRRKRHGRQCLAGAAAQHAARHGASRSRRVANAFGDRYVYNLCPSAPDARAYAIGLARGCDGELSGLRRFAGDAGLSALCAWLSPRIRAQPRPIAGSTTSWACVSAITA